MTESSADMPQTKKYYYEPTFESWARHSLIGMVVVVVVIPFLLIVFSVALRLAETLGVSMGVWAQGRLIFASIVSAVVIVPLVPIFAMLVCFGPPGLRSWLNKYDARQYEVAMRRRRAIAAKLRWRWLLNWWGFDEAKYFSDDNADGVKLLKMDSGKMLRGAIADVSKVVGAKAKELGADAAERSVTLGTTTLARSKELTHSTVERAKQLAEAGRAKLPLRKARKGPADAEPPAAPPEVKSREDPGG